MGHYDLHILKIIKYSDFHKLNIENQIKTKKRIWDQKKVLQWVIWCKNNLWLRKLMVESVTLLFPMFGLKRYSSVKIQNIKKTHRKDSSLHNKRNVEVLCIKAWCGYLIWKKIALDLDGNI